MLYAIILRDNPGAGEARKTHRDGHSAHFKAHQDKIALSGPMTHDDGAGAGSLVVFEAASEAAARTFIEADPFYPAQVWSDVLVAGFKASLFDAELIAKHS